MIYPIVKYGDPVLETPAPPVTVFDDKLKQLVEDMFESMYEAQGVGLAAPQIGISLHLAVIDTTFKEDPDARIVLANAEVINTEGKQSGHEGCLSIPDFRETLARAKKVRCHCLACRMAPSLARSAWCSCCLSAVALCGSSKQRPDLCSVNSEEMSGMKASRGNSLELKAKNSLSNLGNQDVGEPCCAHIDSARRSIDGRLHCTAPTQKPSSLCS